jgi:hypothetical protein
MASRPRKDQPRARTDPAGPTDTGPDDDQPTFLSMVGLVALVVAVVILVFFGIGYLFGRVFL